MSKIKILSHKVVSWSQKHRRGFKLWRLTPIAYVQLDVNPITIRSQPWWPANSLSIQDLRFNGQTMSYILLSYNLVDKSAGHSTAARHREIAGLIAISPGYFVFKSETVKVKVKYGFVLHTGFSRISLSTCKWVECPVNGSDVPYTF